MKRLMQCLLLLVVVTGTVFCTTGCRKANPEDAETQALARQFMEAVYVKRDSTLAMSLVSPVTRYGYVTKEMVDDIIATEAKNQCSTVPESLEVSALGIDMKIPELTATDSTKGITGRVGWKVVTIGKCTGLDDEMRVAIVELEQVNGKWGITRVTWQTGMGGTYDGGLS
ncbi:MAG: hypothetical protein ACYCZF_06130 [Anaerolineae bacterium]